LPHPVTVQNAGSHCIHHERQVHDCNWPDLPQQMDHFQAGGFQAQIHLHELQSRISLRRTEVHPNYTESGEHGQQALPEISGNPGHNYGRKCVRHLFLSRRRGRSCTLFCRLLAGVA